MRYMAFSKLTGVNSDCGPSNGLSNLMKQFGQDRTLQQERYVPQGESSKSSAGFRTPYAASPSVGSDSLANEFFQAEHLDRSNVSSPFQKPSPMRMDSFPQEDWAQEFSLSNRYSQPSSPMVGGMEEFEQVYQRHSSNQSPSVHVWKEEFNRMHKSPSPEKMVEDDAFQRAFEQVGNNNSLQHRDWDKEFADHESWEAKHKDQLQQRPVRPSRPIPRSSSQLLDTKDWSEEFSKYHDLTAQEMEALSKSIENEDDWIQRYQKSIDNKEPVSEMLQKEWDRLKPDGKPYGYRAIHPEYEKYNYMDDNPYLRHQDAIDSVVHSTLADAIMALEAKAQLNPDDAKTWEQLGLKQQENERDAAAITALEKAVSIDAGCLDAWLALAVSYTNEHCRMDAYNCLEQWIANSPKYKHILPEKLGQNYTNEVKRHEYITQLFLEAARAAPGEEMDADVQVGLGVLFNMSEEYEKAVDCFKAALISRPRDYQLWNKVGATLANSRDSVGAIEMYFNALQINPSFVRARYNLGISCMNLGQYQEAAEHLLTALDLQRAAALSAGKAIRAMESEAPIDIPNGTSDGIWDSLRLLMYMMSREDLAAQCDHHNLDAFRGQFDF